MSSRRRTCTRRAIIAAGALGVCCVGGGTGLFFTARWLDEPESNIGEVELETPLFIPPLLDPEPDGDGRKVFDLTIQTGETQIVDAGVSETWGINGAFLAPTLRARRGDLVSFAVHNELPENTTLHWHGMHLPAAYDGGPHQTIRVGASWHPAWEIDQPASTLWYHPHPHGKTAEHVYKGVSGLFIIDDDESDALDLPREYGVDDIPLIIQDKKFDGDGQLSMDPGGFVEQFGGAASFGVMGGDILVNGTYGPVFEPTRRLTRFRLLNGSNARFYNVGFSDDRSFRLIATDNGFVSGEPVELTRISLGPAERVELVVELEPGDDVILRSFEQDLGSNGQQVGAEDTFDLLRVRAGDELEESPDLPEELGGGGAPAVPDDATVRSFSLDGHSSINGKEMDMSRIDLVIPARALEVWEVRSAGQPHTFHIHGATFHVLEVDGSEPPPELRGPKDTVFVGPGHPVRLAVQFREYTDPELPYMYHCHILRHEDNGMMGQFVVVEPGTEGSVSTTIETHDHH